MEREVTQYVGNGTHKVLFKIYSIFKQYVHILYAGKVT